ncbi:MAG: NAD(P)-binding protein [Lentisphaeria bacterium]|nr:NAD(P)-binding protein [Lentisphaeria bacterium]
MTEPQTLVVGSGAGGLTLALLLAKAGRSVTLVEIQPTIGGYLRRFVRNGVFFDSGYHFSGGFENILRQMHRILGIDDLISGMPISNRIILKASQQCIDLPAGCGYAGALDEFSHHFPAEKAALSQLFDTVRSIWTNRQMGNLYDCSPMQLIISQYDSTTVREFCDRIGLSPAAETSAGSFAVCHGSPPADVPMSFHARVGFSLYDSLARPVGGGDSIIHAFKREAAKFGITIRTGSKLLRFSEPDSDGECHLAFFSDGSSLPVDEVFFTIHPKSVQELLPENIQSPQFRRRMLRLRETTSFFCVYYTVDDGIELPEGLLSFFSENDLDSILRGTGGYSTGYLALRSPDVHGRMRSIITAFRTMPVMTPPITLPHHARISDPDYQGFKARISEEITWDLLEVYPHLKGHLHIEACGSPLTCLDYDPPTGSAYGVRCVCGQSRLCGALPVKNFYLAGQSASIPGVMGTMMTSFIVFRMAVGDEIYRRVIEGS